MTKLIVALRDCSNVHRKLNFKKIGRESVDWIHLDPEAGCCAYGNEHFGSLNAGSFLDQLTDSVSRMELVQSFQM